MRLISVSPFTIPSIAIHEYIPFATRIGISIAAGSMRAAKEYCAVCYEPTSKQRFRIVHMFGGDDPYEPEILSSKIEQSLQYEILKRLCLIDHGDQTIVKSRVEKRTLEKCLTSYKYFLLYYLQYGCRNVIETDLQCRISPQPSSALLKIQVQDWFTLEVSESQWSS